MKREGKFCTQVLKGLQFRNSTYVTVHDDSDPAIPDLSVTIKRPTVNTWLVLMHIDTWPTERVHWEGVRQGQLQFIRDRRGWLMARIGVYGSRKTASIYALFDGVSAWEMRDGFTRRQFIENATHVWYENIRWADFMEAIQ